MNASDLDNCADGASGNNSCTLLCGLEEDMLGPEQPMHLVRNRPRREGDMHQVFLGLFDRFRDCDWNFSRLSLPDADPPLSISHDNQCAEVEPFPTLHDFRHSIDKNNLVFQA
jgi:hypothetical protein